PLCWHWSLPTVPPQTWTGLAGLAVLGRKRDVWARRDREVAARDVGHAGSLAPPGRVGWGGTRSMPPGLSHSGSQVSGGGMRGCRCARITVGAAADVLRRRSGLAGRVGVDGVAFRGGEPERSRVLRGSAPSPAPAVAQTGEGKSGGEPPAAVPQRCSVRPGVAG